MRTLPWVPIALLAVSGCGSSSPQLRTRAAADLQCDAQQLQVKEVRYEVYEVSGCHHTGTYVFDQDTGAWIRESESGKTVEEPP